MVTPLMPIDSGATGTADFNNQSMSPVERNLMTDYLAWFACVDACWLDRAKILRDIRGRRLYREQWPSFDAFCRRELEMGKSNVDRLLQCAEIADDLATIVAAPKRENHVRPLLKLDDPSKRRVAYKNAVDLAAKTGKPFTGTLVAGAVRDLRPPALESPPPTVVRTKADLLTRITRNIARGLERLEENELQRLGTVLENCKNTWLKEHVKPNSTSTAASMT